MHILKYPEVFLHIHCLGIFYILPNFQNVFNLKFSVSVFQYYLPGPLQLAELSGWCDWSPLVVGLGSGATRESHTSHRLHHQQLLDMETSTVLVHSHKPCADVFHKQIGVFFILCSWCPKHFPWYIGNRLENHPLGLLEIILVIWRQLQVYQILILQKPTAPVVNNAFIWCYESHWIFSLVGANGGVFLLYRSFL